MKKLLMMILEVAGELNNFLKTAVASLDIHRSPYTVENVENMSDPVEKAMKKIHPSTLLIKNKIGQNVSQNFFCFNEVAKVELLKEINSINNKKANPFNTISSVS